MITINTRILAENCESLAVKKACDALLRDIKSTCNASDKKGILIALREVADVEPERFIIDVKKADEGDAESSCLVISAADDFGFIYGLYHISRHFLGVNDFWFWNEQQLTKKDGYEIPSDYHYVSEPFKVRFRGWFINDEVLFDGWKEAKKDKTGKDDNLLWEMAFETLLRCGGNMTIPGTDFNAHIYNKLANDYGLWITHHHAEPMGARMFARAYPDLEASFDKHAELFRGLWREAIEKQKDYKIIWNIGFRGQGDRPFWIDDPKYDTPEARGRLMSDLMLEQYNMIKENDRSAVCCMNLYGEIMELYKGGYLSIPDDVIKIWADNGFGKMVSRRQNNHNPRVFALPEKNDESAHGIYYHASFYDLQAAAMMTMLPNSPEFVIRELSEVFERRVDDFWIINCSNVKPHTYYLDLIARMWRGEIEPCFENMQNAQKEADKFTLDFCKAYYGGTEAADDIAGLYSLWPSYAVKYGPNEDDHAGEQFSNHGSRILACAFLSGFDKEKPERTAKTDELNWLLSVDTLAGQVKWHLEKYGDGVKGYREYHDRCNEVKEKIRTSGDGAGELAKSLDDNLICQVQYHYYSYLGAYHICRALLTCLEENDSREKSVNALEESGTGKNIDYIAAFYEAGLARKAFLRGYELMRGHEHGIWEGFYKNDCEADIRQSAFVAEALMSYIRILGDGPHFYKWQRHFQEGAGGDKVHLILRIKEYLADKEIWKLMDDAHNVKG